MRAWTNKHGQNARIKLSGKQSRKNSKGGRECIVFNNKYLTTTTNLVAPPLSASRDNMHAVSDIKNAAHIIRNWLGC